MEGILLTINPPHYFRKTEPVNTPIEMIKKKRVLAQKDIMIPNIVGRSKRLLIKLAKSNLQSGCGCRILLAAFSFCPGPFDSRPTEVCTYLWESASLSQL